MPLPESTQSTFISWAQLEVSTCLVSHSPGTQNCGNSRLPHQSHSARSRPTPTLHTITWATPRNHLQQMLPEPRQSTQTFTSWAQLEVSTCLVSHSPGTQNCGNSRLPHQRHSARSRPTPTLHTPTWTTPRNHLQQMLPESTQSTFISWAQLEVSTCLVSHSPGTQNCGNSRLPHQGHSARSRPTPTLHTPTWTTPRNHLQQMLPESTQSTQTFTSWAQLEVSTCLVSHSPGTQNCGTSRLPHQSHSARSRPTPTLHTITWATPRNHLQQMLPEPRQSTQTFTSWAQLEVSTCLVSHSPGTQNCGNSRLPHQSHSARSRPTPTLHTPTWTTPRNHLQQMLPASTQSSQTFTSWAQLEVSTCLVSHSPGTQNCGNSRLPHQRHSARSRPTPTLHTPTWTTSRNHLQQMLPESTQSSQTFTSWAQLEVSTCLVSHSPGTQNCGNSRLPHQSHSARSRPTPTLHTPTLHTPTWTTRRNHLQQILPEPRQSTQTFTSWAQLEVSTCLVSHSPGTQNCGNSRLPHQSHSARSRPTKTLHTPTWTTPRNHLQQMLPESTQSTQTFTSWAQLEVSTCLVSHSPGTQNCGNSRLPHQGHSARSRPTPTLHTPTWTTSRNHLQQMLPESTQSSQTFTSWAQLEVSTCLVSHSPGTQNCGTSRLPHQSHSARSRPTPTLHTPTLHTPTWTTMDNTKKPSAANAA